MEQILGWNAIKFLRYRLDLMHTLYELENFASFQFEKWSWGDNDTVSWLIYHYLIYF